MNLTNDIKAIILNAIPDATVYIVDPDGQHFEAIVISPSFEGKMLVKQHQMVMKPLKEKFETTMHALALKTFTPDKWEKEKDKYPSHLFN